jgi:hypothetical protein
MSEPVGPVVTSQLAHVTDVFVVENATRFFCCNKQHHDGTKAFFPFLAIFVLCCWFVLDVMMDGKRMRKMINLFLFGS